MRILVYALNFSPELTGTGKYTGEMVRWLAAHGHEVRVVTSAPYYPEWSVREGYDATSYMRESSGGVEVVRCPLWVPRRASGWRRLVHLLSFAASSLPVVLAQVRWRPHVVWTVEPALLTSPAALMVAKLARSATWLHIQDYEIDAAFAMGLLRGERARRFALKCETWLMRRFDRVSTISGKMLQLGKAKGVAPAKLVYFPNWVDVSEIRPLDSPSRYRTELGIPKGAVVVLYSGNMGAKQGLEVLAAAAQTLSGASNIFFLFCGDGVAKVELQALCGSLKNVRFIPLQPLCRLNELLCTADLHVLPQRADAADLLLPSKLTGMLASGRAVIATAKPETEVGQIIKKAGAGELVPPGDGNALGAAIRRLVDEPRTRHAMGTAARLYAEKELSGQYILSRFEAEMKAIAGSGESRA